MNEYYEQVNSNHIFLVNHFFSVFTALKKCFPARLQNDINMTIVIRSLLGRYNRSVVHNPLFLCFYCKDVFFCFQWILKREIARWFVMAMIGVLTGLVASFIDFAVEYTSDLKFSFIKHGILDSKHIP